ncbi:hypothetical protein VaNZ11_007141 [Volvox africanus]|uniref:Heterogeneous nuclear ribonucleoprotein Q acidic domain-containing protein n=1 Tax=Volvox africanus TaxID=51714 RepID=A0ABQ5S3D8_9CHLO|nr:hypothetical protein VaNZ11_007141 [Volvox africanus]
MESHKRSADVAGMNGEGGPDYKSARLPDRFESCDHRLRDRIMRLVAGGRVRAEDVDDKALDLLKSLKVDDAINVIDQFERAVHGGNVKNKSAYLAGVATRHKHFGHGPKLPKEVQQRLEQLYRSGKLRDSQVLDVKVLEAINDMEPSLALRVIENFEGKDLEDARNINALFMATIKITKEQIARERSYGMPPPAHGYRDTLPPPHHHGMNPPPPYGMNPPPSYSPPPPYSAPPPPPPYGAPSSYAPPMMHAPPPMAAAPAPTPMRRNYGSEQSALGVRIDELHNLSPHAPFVPGSVAMTLQRAWDSGNRLVSLLDEGSWKALTEMESQHGQQVVNEVVEAMNNQQIRNCNAFLISVAKKFLTGSASTPAAGSYGGSSGAAGNYGGSSGGSYGGASYASGGAGGQKGVPALNRLHGVLGQRAQDLLVQHSHVLRDSHFDEVVVSQLQKLPEHEALEVLAEVGRHELVGVKNIPAYIMGIINRYKRGGSRPSY